jgi:hypothetical protein
MKTLAFAGVFFFNGEKSRGRGAVLGCWFLVLGSWFLDKIKIKGIRPMQSP